MIIMLQKYKKKKKKCTWVDFYFIIPIVFSIFAPNYIKYEEPKRIKEVGKRGTECSES